MLEGNSEHTKRNGAAAHNSRLAQDDRIALKCQE